MHFFLLSLFIFSGLSPPTKSSAFNYFTEEFIAPETVSPANTKTEASIIITPGQDKSAILTKTITHFPLSPGIYDIIVKINSRGASIVLCFLTDSGTASVVAKDKSFEVTADAFDKVGATQMEGLGHIKKSFTGTG